MSRRRGEWVAVLARCFWYPAGPDCGPHCVLGGVARRVSAPVVGRLELVGARRALVWAPGLERWAWVDVGELVAVERIQGRRRRRWYRGRYGLPNAIEWGDPMPWAPAGALYVDDDDDGRPVAFHPPWRAGLGARSWRRHEGRCGCVACTRRRALHAARLAAMVRR